MIAQVDDGYCIHLDRETYKCTVYEHRTVPCRGQVWMNYEKKVINPELMEQIDESNVKIYSFPEVILESNCNTK